MSDLATKAEQLNLPTLAKAIRGAELPAPAPNDALLDKPLPSELIPAMQLMPRRGLDARLVEVMRRGFADRPLELGLLAWDVLSGSFIDSPELLVALRKDARAVRDVLPEPGARHSKFTGVSSADLVDRLAGSRWKDVSLEQLLEAGHRRDLGAMREMQRRGLDDKMESTGFLRDSHRWAVSLSLMHCPTLSSFYLDFLWRGLLYRPALADLCDVLLDSGAVECLPSDEQLLADGSDEDVDLMAYVDGRRAVVTNHTKDKLKQYESSPVRLDYAKGSPADLAKVFPRAQLVEAEIAVRWDKVRVPIQVVTEIVRARPEWRYAERVLLTMIGAFSDKDSNQPLTSLDAYVNVFGNDFRAWYSLMKRAPDEAVWFDGVIARVVREATILPHDDTVWTLLAMLVSEEEDGPAVQETYRRTEMQCRLD
jgi:hypothetical protein